MAVGANFGRRSSVASAFQQNDLKPQQRRGSAPGHIPGTPGRRSSIPGTCSPKSSSDFEVKESGSESEGASSSSSSARRRQRKLESTLAMMQLRIRNDLREELRPFHKIREDVQNLPTRILAGLARVDRVMQHKAGFSEAAAFRQEPLRPKKTGGLSRLTPPEKQEFALCRPSSGQSLFDSSPVEPVALLPVIDVIGPEEGIGSGVTAVDKNRGRAVSPVGCVGGRDLSLRSGTPAGAEVYMNEGRDEASRDTWTSQSAMLRPGRARKTTAVAHSLDRWARRADDGTALADGDSCVRGTSEGAFNGPEPTAANHRARLSYPQEPTITTNSTSTSPHSEASGDPEDWMIVKCRRRLGRWVRGTGFDYLSGALVVLNAISLGAQTDWQARHVTSETPPFYRALEVCFCVVFTIEILLRLIGHGRGFFSRANVLWHLFDSFLVITQLLEEFMRLAAAWGWVDDPAKENPSGQRSKSKMSNLSALRVVRILRLIRVMRLMRVLRLIGELRTLVMSIIGSLRSLVWAVALLFLMMYVMGVYLTQLILDHRLEDDTDHKNSDEILLVRYYGSLGDTVLSVYMSIFGGLNWEDILAPLRRQISEFVTPFFMFYIAFATLCMLNVITGVFVESALLTAKQDQDSYMVGTVQMVFDDYDLDKNGRMSFLEFQRSLVSPDMKQVLGALEIDVSQAHGLFDLLDRDRVGSINAKDFVMGCAKLRGPAKALDLAILMREIDVQRSDLVQHVEHVNQTLEFLCERLEDMGSGMAKPAAPFKVQTVKDSGLRQFALMSENLLAGLMEVEEV